MDPAWSIRTAAQIWDLCGLPGTGPTDGQNTVRAVGLPRHERMGVPFSNSRRPFVLIPPLLSGYICRNSKQGSITRPDRT